ncbi:MAG: ribosomal RNA small subunit methyltransferase H [Candidatus Binatia bacterium]|nr:MAG: ribosomal RNA small subunit methyltransferase H [Candidatus Binatia bacterium]
MKDGPLSGEGRLHVPVLLREVVELLALPRGARAVDATFGAGGHARVLLEAVGPRGQVLAIERDPSLVERARGEFSREISSGRLVLFHGNFRELEIIARDAGFSRVEGILFDLGLSSYHLEAAGRGFSYERDEPLDLRFDPTEPGTEPAHALLRRLSAEELARLLALYGEERYARRIARKILGKAPVRTSAELARAVRAALPAPARRFADRSAARVFQALRIAVNDELRALEEALPRALGLLSRGGRLAVISFHSLEDRIVKRAFREAARRGEVAILTKKPVVASDEERRENPRSRSAKLRAVEKR